MKQERITIVLDIELIGPGVELFHVRQSGTPRDLYLYRDERGRLRPVTPVRDVPTPLGAWLGDLPLPQVIEAAFPKDREAA